MIAGRPTKLTPELIESAWEYIESVTNVGVQVLLPTIEGLALHLEIRRDTLYEWEKENEAFSDILAKLRSLQAQKLIQNSLVGRYNPTIAKMMLSKHGYVEAHDENIRVKEMPTPILGGLSKDVSGDNSASQAVET